MRGLYTAAVVVSVAAALAGCGKSSPGISTAAKTNPSAGSVAGHPSPAPSSGQPIPTPTAGQPLPTPTGAAGTTTATIDDYRKALGTSLDDYRAAWTKYLGDCAGGIGSDVCKQDIVVVNLQSGLIALELENAYMADSPVYVGLPPAQIADIVNRAHADARKTATDSDPDKPVPAALATDGAALNADVTALMGALG